MIDSSRNNIIIFDNEDILLELDGSNNITARYTHGPGIDEPLVMEKAGPSFFYQADGLGSITEITNASGTVVQAYTYSSFGKIESQLDPTFIQPYTFTAREFDPETDLYFYRNRTYDWRTGRFHQEDPVLHAGNPRFPHLLPFFLSDPTLLHTTIYPANNPVIYVDPWGLWRFPDYVSANINIAIPTPWTGTLLGWSGQIALDRNGNLYAAPLGGTVGKAATFVSGSLTAGWLNQCGKPSEDKLKDFLTANSFNFGGGFWGGGGVAWTPGVGTATEVGLVTPQAGVSYHYSYLIRNLGISW